MLWHWDQSVLEQHRDLAGAPSALAEEREALPQSVPAPAAESLSVLNAYSAATAVQQVAADTEALPEEVVLAWDEPDDVRLLHRRIQALQDANADLAWDEVGVPLEQLTKSRANGTRGLQTVGSARRNQQ